MVSTSLLGVFASLLAALFFGLYPIPRRYVNFGIADYMLSMSLGVTATTLVINLVSGTSFFALSLTQLALALLAGVVWAVGTVFYVYSVDCIGVGRATPIKNITAAFGVIFGLLVFGEYRGLGVFELFYLGIGTFLVILGGRYLGSVQGKQGIARPSCPANLVTPGFIGRGEGSTLIAGGVLAFITAFLYGLQSIPVRVLSSSTASILQFLPAVGFGALLASALVDLLLTTDHTWREVSYDGHLIAAFSGSLWTFGFLGLAFGVNMVGLAVSWPIAMSSTVFAVLYGLLIGKEIMFGRKVAAGLFVALLGVVFIGASL